MMLLPWAAQLPQQHSVASSAAEMDTRNDSGMRRGIDTDMCKAGVAVVILAAVVAEAARAAAIAVVVVISSTSYHHYYYDYQ